jgi:AcrR family transcriptional regulator
MRMLVAMARLACEKRLGNVTVADVVARSRVSRRTFYEIFEDREDCLIAALDEAVARASHYTIGVADPKAGWADRVRDSLASLLQFLDDEPDFGRLVVVESLAGGPVVLRRRAQVLAGMIAFVDSCREEARRRIDPPPLTAESVVGAVFSVIHSRMLEPRDDPFVGLVNPLMAMVVLPYLGPAASRRELGRTAPNPKRPPRPSRPEQFATLDMRLTYRTMRVLAAIGSHPGLSNRGVADAAGVYDPGQISKLLTRLSQVGLIEKAASGSARGEPNAWMLTRRGEEVHGVISPQTE